MCKISIMGYQEQSRVLVWVKILHGIQLAALVGGVFLMISFSWNRHVSYIYDSKLVKRLTFYKPEGKNNVGIPLLY